MVMAVLTAIKIQIARNLLLKSCFTIDLSRHIDDLLLVSRSRRKKETG
jgi:hypothetical protein